LATAHPHSGKEERRRFIIASTKAGIMPLLSNDRISALPEKPQQSVSSF
jgi:hypothetical protein